MQQHRSFQTPQPQLQWNFSKPPKQTKASDHSYQDNHLTKTSEKRSSVNSLHKTLPVVASKHTPPDAGENADDNKGTAKQSNDEEPQLTRCFLRSRLSWR